MFDIGFSEMLLVAIVALVVLGPERLPKAARFVGLWLRRARAQWYSVKSELEREIAAEELQRSLREARTTTQQIDTAMRATTNQVREEFESISRGGVIANDATQTETQLDDTAAAEDAPSNPQHLAQRSDDQR